jgi:protein involved in polysaccharide export with SLBB domain
MILFRREKPSFAGRLNQDMLRTLLQVSLFIAVLAPAAGAQAIDRTPVQVTRDSLVQLLSRLEQTASSKGYSGALRDRARQEAELVRTRLQQGDFQVGDRIYLKVERQPELTDTFTVAPGPSLVLPSIREVPLAGLLRSELEEHLEQHLKRFLVDPVVEATPLMRVWIEGAVGAPGVYLVPSETVVTDALMRAGGLTREAKISALRIERGETRIWEGEALQRAITQGYTLDQLSIRAGDRIVVGEGGRSRLASLQTIVAIVVSLTTLLITQVF